MQTQRKKLDPLIVRSAATTLILAEGNTTTLRVKKFLRQRGYDARQTDVSQWMLVIGLWENWAIEDNGIHRTYFFPTFRFSLQ
jgi:hypothetical protein